jgi:hypothetical protein
MKILKIPLLLSIVLLLTSFIYIDINQEDKTYVKFRVSGNQINNTFSIKGDQNNANQNVTAMIFPDGNSGEYKIAELSFMDLRQEMSVLFTIPAKSGLIELKEGNPTFKLVISIGDIALKAQSVSVNVEEVVIDKIMRMKASYVKGSFEGIAIHKYTKNNREVEEPYMVSGKFQFMSPRYKPKK